MKTLAPPDGTLREPKEIWRGRAELWTSDAWHLALWKQAHVLTDGEQIIVRLPQQQVRFTLADVVEARSFRLPLPSLTLIIEVSGGHQLISLFMLGGAALSRLQEATGLAFTDRRLWRTGLEAGRDQRKYSLQR